MLADLQGGGLRLATTTIVLHGSLAKRYGRRHQLGVKTAPQAAYALSAMIPGFREEFQDGWYRVVRGRVADGIVLTPEQLHLQAAPGGEIHFIPVARGGKNSGGTMKAVLGAVILVAAVVVSAGALGPVAGGLGATAFSVAGAGVSFGSIAFFGATMLLSGVASLLSSSSKLNTTDPKTSYSLSGPTNSTAEGTPIPAVYGRTRVGSVVGSFGYYAEDYDGTSAPTAEPDPSATTGNSGAVGAGGKGASGSGATEAPNTLRSRAVVRVLDILSEGPIGGLVDGAKSIYFNNTPLMASDGSYNFQGVTWDERTGYPSQDAVAGYPASEQTNGVNIEVQHLGAGAITRTYSSPNATAARVTIRLPALAHQNPTNGNLEAFPQLNYTIAVSPSGANAFVTVVNEVFTNQKCTSPYERSYRFDLPASAQTWDIRITKITADSTTANDQCSVIWEATTLITDQALMHPNVAYLALTIDAAAFGSSIPTRQYEIDGILCQIPQNYDPTSGTYATSGPGTSLGTWDGASFQLQATSNPAWCLYDMLLNQRYGMGLDSDLSLNSTKFDLSTISQYCDGTVPSGFTDGSGNMIQERRYTLNVALTQQVDAYRLLQSMVSAFRGMTYWGAGRVVVTADMPTAPSYVLNPSNVIDGDFSYEGSALKTRHTVARVSWLDPANSYMEAIEVVEDFDAVVSQGQVPTDILAFGATSRGLARRWGKWLLDTERNQTELLSCSIGLEELRSRPGDVVRVADPAYAGVRMGGRLSPYYTDQATLHLDQAVVATPGVSYFISVTMPDGTVADRVSVNYFSDANGSSVAHLNAALPAVPLANATWVLSSDGPPGLLPVETRQFRVLALSEPKHGQYQMSGVVHDPNKYARVELGIQFDPTPFSTLNGLLVAPLPAPTNVAAVDYLTGVGTTTTIRVSVGWTSPTDVRVVSYQVHTEGPEQRDIGVIGTQLDIDGLIVGLYTMRVRSVGRDGRTSIWADSAQINVDGKADPPDAPLNFTGQGGALQSQLSWNSSLARDILHYELWRAPAAANGTHPFPFAGYNPVGSPSSNNASLVVKVAATTFIDAGDELAPDTAWAYWVCAVNTTGVASAFSGPIKTLTTYYLAASIDEGIRNTAPIAEALLGSAPKALADLSSPGTSDGELALNASDSKLYRWNAAANNGLGAWQLYIPLIPNALGQITDASIAALDATKIQGAFTPEQNAAVVSAIADGQITDRMIASLAGSKISGQLSSNASMQAGQIYDVDPVTGEVIKGVDTTKLLGTIGTTQITDGAITTQKIGANQVTVNNITAGAITGNKLAIAGAGNVIGNPCCQVSAWGWQPFENLANPGNFLMGSVTGDGYAPAVYALAGEGSGVITASGTMAGNNSELLQAYWDPDSTQGIACQAGDWWEGQAYLGAHRCWARVGLQFFSSVTKQGVSGAIGNRVAGQLGGSLLSQYGFSWVKGQVPAGADRVILVIQAYNDNGADIGGGTPGQNPYLFWTHAVLAPSTPLSIAAGAQPQPYTIGGVTQIVGGMIKTGAVTARQISAGAVDATKVTVGSVSNVITNSCCTVTASGWSSSAAISAVPVYSAYLLSGYGTGQILAGSLPSGAYTDTSWAPDGAPYAPDGSHGVAWAAAVSCAPGDLWEAQARVITAGCSSTLHIIFMGQDTAGNWQLMSAPNTGGQAWPTPADGRMLGQYHLQSVRGAAPGPGMANGVYCPNGATLVTLMIRQFNDAAAQAVFGSGTQTNARIYFTQTALGIAQTAVAPMEWAPGGATQIDGGQIKANSIVAGTLAAGAVVAGNIQAGSIGVAQLAAGSITADKLAVGSSANLIWNSDPDQGLDGWTAYAVGIAGIQGTAAAYNASYALRGTGSGWAQYVASGLVYSNQSFNFDWNPAGLSGQSGVGYGLASGSGETWGAAAYLCSGNNARSYIVINFYDFSMNQLAAFPSAAIVNNNSGGGIVLDQYTRVTVTALSPAGTCFVLFQVKVAGAPGGATQPFCAWTHAQLCQIPDGASQVGPYEPGGVTTISGGMVKTGSLLANRITAGSITTNQISAGGINADRLVANSITAGQIQAAAIGADQIAAGAIRTVHLAADFAIVASAQIGTAVIDSAQIKNLAVGNNQMGYGSVTNSAYASAGAGPATLVAQVYVGYLGNYSQSLNGVLLLWRTIGPEPNSATPKDASEGGSG